jgi:hypothetical protein
MADPDIGDSEFEYDNLSNNVFNYIYVYICNPLVAEEGVHAVLKCVIHGGSRFASP